MSKTTKIVIEKPQLSLVPPSTLIVIAQALQDGINKHGGMYNWRNKGREINVMTYLSKAMRHIAQYLDGENEASDSNVPHLGHAMADLALLYDALHCGTGVDDRPAKGAASKLIESTD